MPDSWFCDKCSSMNRGQADHCYRCQAPKAQAAFATARDRRPGDALMPGVDRLEPQQAKALLGRYPYTNPAVLGYLSVITFTVQLATALVAVAGGIALVLSTAAPDAFQVTEGMARLLAVATVVTATASLLSFVCYGAFLGLTTRNVPGLAGGTPRFGSRRTAFWWLEAAFWQWVATLIVWVLPGILLVVLLLLLWAGASTLGLFGLIGVIVAIWSLGRYTGIRIDFPQFALETIRRPARPLEDLTDRLEVQGSPGARLVSLWSTSWVGAWAIRCFLPYLVLGLYVAIAVAITARALAGFGVDNLPSESQVERAATLFVVLMVLVAALADLLAIFFMTRLTLALVEAQHTRRRWLLEAASGKGVLVTPTPGGPTSKAWPAQPSEPAPPRQPPVVPAREAPPSPADLAPGMHPLARPSVLPGRPAPPASGTVIGVVRETPVPPAPPAPPASGAAAPESGPERPKSRPDIPGR